MARETMSDSLSAQLIQMRHGGASWKVCATQLGHTPGALQRRARRLRDADSWRLPSGKVAKGAPRVGIQGRPRNETRSVPVSPRFTPEVAAELRHVATEAGVLLGEVVAESLYRACTRAAGKRVASVPYGLERAQANLPTRPRTATVSVNIPAPLYADFVNTLDGETAISHNITEAVHGLLADLGYMIQ